MKKKRNELENAKFYFDWYLTPWLSELYCEFALLPNGDIYKSNDDKGEEFELYYKKENI